jgi:hypothetical protein
MHGALSSVLLSPPQPDPGPSPLPPQVSSGSPALSIPQPKDDVSVWDARDHHVHLPWRSLRDVLGAVRWVDGSVERYRQLAASGKNIFVSQPNAKARRRASTR